MKIINFFKMPNGTAFITDKPFDPKILHHKVRIDNVGYVVTGITVDDNKSFMIQEKISEIKNKEIEFVN